MKVVRKIILTEKGFTLAELLIGMAVMVLIIGAVALTLDAGMRSQRFNFDLNANLQDERRIINQISDEIRNAVQITSPLAGEAEIVAITYRRADDPADRTISQGEDDNASTIFFTDPVGNTQGMGIGRVRSLRFARDAAIPRRITITLVLANSARNGAPVTTINTSVYTLN